MKQIMLNRLEKLLKSEKTWRLLVLGIFLGSASLGYCDISDTNADFEAQIKSVQDIIFGKHIRTMVLLFGMAWGFFKTFMSGTFTPILLYGGLGLSFFLVPKLIALINSAA